MMSCHDVVTGFEFSPEEIERAARNSELLSMEIEFTLRCNFRCPYCYTPDKPPVGNELADDEIRDVIAQAQELGARKVIVLGGEPMMYPHVLEMIRFITERGLEVEMFTNGSNITPEVARELFARGTRVVLKMNTFDPRVQDVLSGCAGAHKIIRQALDNLRAAGYPSDGAVLAASTVICQQNFDEVVGLWQWLRDQEILPYFEMITPQSNAKQNEWLNVEIDKLHGIFQTIAELDRTRYGHDWEPQPPLVGNRCLRHRFSCLVTSQGQVMPCVGVTIPLGNIRERRLRDILADSEVAHDLRDFRQTIKGPCRTCDKAEHCYGCRGAAYQLTGDYLASDPLCWRNVDRQDEIEHLPVAVDDLIPQKAPMRVVDSLDRVAERTADTSVTISDGMLLVDGDGALDESAYLEMMAQSIAALNGFRQRRPSAAEPQGFLLGAKKLEIRQNVDATRTGWIAARCSGLPDHPGAYIAAHTSPVYVRCGDSRPFDGPAMEHMLGLVEGGIEYLNTLATAFDEDSRNRMVRVYKEVQEELKVRLVTEGGHSHGDGPYRRP